MKKAAVLIGKLGGKKVYRYPVLVRVNSPMGRISDWLYPPEVETDVVSASAADAADWARELMAGTEYCEIEVYGPKGGIAARRFIGAESAIWDRMNAIRSNQFNLDFFPS